MQCGTGSYALAGLSDRTDWYTPLPASEAEAQRAAAAEELKVLPLMARLSEKEDAKLFHDKRKSALRRKAMNMGYREYPLRLKPICTRASADWCLLA